MSNRGWYGNIIAWFAHNSVAANLLMLALIVGGVYTAITITKEEVVFRNPTNAAEHVSVKEVEVNHLCRWEEVLQLVSATEGFKAAGQTWAGFYLFFRTQFRQPELLAAAACSLPCAEVREQCAACMRSSVWRAAHDQAAWLVEPEDGCRRSAEASEL